MPPLSEIYFPIVKIGNYSLASWQIFWVLARVFFVMIVYREAVRLDLNRRIVIGIAVFNFFAVSFFEKILFFLSQKALHQSNLNLSLNNWFSWGRVYFGALIGLALAVLVGAIVSRSLKKIPRYFDVMLTASAVTLIFYRLGNFLGQTHPGTMTDFPLGFYFKGVARHNPVFYELISLAILSVFIWKLRKRIKTPGVLALIITGWLSLSRVITDSFRADDLPASNFHFQNGFTLNQLAYFILFWLCFLALLALFIFKKQLTFNKKGGETQSGNKDSFD
ncbi:MAG: hypothetical protein FJZ04_01680 [Candidatus Moranbacteria bacterium]|nr:hypothetical protein [Candidatus Moranbacteria bacterium]